MLCHPEAAEPSPDVAAIVEELWPRAHRRSALAGKLERLLSVWLLNCFEHSEEPVGFSTFFLPSFLSHSCRPNCMWHYKADDFVLRARQDIAEGDEVTVSYLAEESLVESTASRRAQLLATKHFICCCGACQAPLDRARGFVCLSCRDGEIFLDVSSAAGLPTASANGACSQCGFLADSSQVAALCAQEAQVEHFVQEWDRRAGRAAPDTYLTDALALRLQANLEGLFSPSHWLRDRTTRHLTAYYEATGRADLALPLATRNADFLQEAYPGCSALRAWALETQGDLQLRLAGFRLVGPSGVEAPGGLQAEQLAGLWREVGPVYAEALETLRVLFGEDHEFYTTMQEKCGSLARATRQAGTTKPARSKANRAR